MATPQAQAVLEIFRFPVRYPGAVIEIDRRTVSAVRMRKEKAGRRLLGYGIVRLQESVWPGPALSPRSSPPDEVRFAVEQAVERAGIKPGRASLLLPDSVARVWLLQLPEMPRKSQAMLDMIRWKIKRSVPFRIEDAAIVWQVLSRPSGAEAGTVLVGLIPQPLIGAYEGLLAGAGLKIGLVDIESFNLFNFCRSAIEKNGAASGDFGLLNATETYFTLLLFRHGEMVFFRCKVHAEADGEASEERAKTLRRELATSLSYYTEKLAGKGLTKTFVRLTDPDLEGAERVLGSLELGAIEPIDASRIAVLPDGVDRETALILAPAMGAALGRNA